MSENEERQDSEQSPDAPVGQPQADDQEYGDHLESPEPGHPVGETEPAESGEDE
jgi:hypothetical protein